MPIPTTVSAAWWHTAVVWYVGVAVVVSVVVTAVGENQVPGLLRSATTSTSSPGSIVTLSRSCWVLVQL